MYNTETATLVGEYQFLYQSDYEYEREELYIKKTGEWFIYGEGGPLSKYREKYGSSSWCGGDVIKPLTENEAREWLEDNNCTDEYIKYFGEPEE